MYIVRFSTIFAGIILFFMMQTVSAQQLKFNKNGNFKIVQFTDLHYAAGAVPSAKSIKMMESTLESEKPDVVIFTGDVVVKAPTSKGWDEVLDVVISRNIPYIVTLGNHDDESEWSRSQVADYLSKKPLLINNRASLQEVDGVLNASIAVMGNDHKAAFTLYAMDSKAYSQVDGIKGYDWFGFNQVNWYLKESAKIEASNGRVIPALAFFHIPFPEYGIAFDKLANKRIGVRYENEGSPIINSGMYAAMLGRKDVIGTFVGHDHVNDYLVDYYGIGLAYGCFSGSENTYVRDKNGARIIELKEGKKGFHTYIREYDGNILNRTDFPFKKQ